MLRSKCSAYTKTGSIQRRFAWPLRKDDTQNREAFQFFFIIYFLLIFTNIPWNVKSLHKCLLNALLQIEWKFNEQNNTLASLHSRINLSPFTKDFRGEEHQRDFLLFKPSQGSDTFLTIEHDRCGLITGYKKITIKQNLHLKRKWKWKWKWKSKSKNRSRMPPMAQCKCWRFLLSPQVSIRSKNGWDN